MDLICTQGGPQWVTGAVPKLKTSVSMLNIYSIRCLNSVVLDFSMDIGAPVLRTFCLA